MLKDKIDIKVIFIFILAVALIISFLTRPSKETNDYQEELDALKEANEKLINTNDSIKAINDELSIEIEELNQSIDSTQSALNDTEDKLNDLKDDKGKVSGYVNSLDADGISESLSEYLNRQGK